MADKDAEQRAVNSAEVKSGIQLVAGHPVVLVVADLHGRPRRSGEEDDVGDPPDQASAQEEESSSGDDDDEAAGKKEIRGAFRVGEHLIKGASFRLHKDTGEGPLITPDGLAGGSTSLRWAGDHWVTGDDGKYFFTGLAEGKYFVELISKEQEP